MVILMKKVFFTGHKNIENDIETISKLMQTIKNLLLEGATDFYAGGAMGWDMLCERAVLMFRDERVPYIKLHLILPCPPEEQTARWSSFDKERHREILETADRALSAVFRLKLTEHPESVIIKENYTEDFYIYENSDNTPRRP